MTDPIDYKVVLADLEAKKTALEATINGMRQWLGLGGHAGGSASTSAILKIDKSSFSKMSLSEAIESYLRRVNEMKTTAEIVKALEDGGIVHASADFRKTVSTTLNQKCRDKDSEITKVRNQWGLSSWGPGMRRAKNSNVLGTEPSAEDAAADLADNPPEGSTLTEGQ